MMKMRRLREEDIRNENQKKERDIGCQEVIF